MLLALLLAFSTWLIHNLALKYNDFLKVPVVAKCELKGYSDKSSNECEVVARCRATGYKVIRAALKSNKKVEVTFRPSDMEHLEGDMFYITSSNLVEYANAIYGTVCEVKEGSVLMEVDNNVKIRVNKNALVKDFTEQPQ